MNWTHGLAGWVVTLASNFNQAAVDALLKAIKTDATKLGVFRRVIGHEPKSAPGSGVSFAYWLGPVTAARGLGGLNSTGGRVIINGRVYAPFLAKDEDITERDLTHALLELIASYSGGFTVGGTVYAIDLLGMHGVSLETGSVGYIEMDSLHYRAADLTIPVLIDNLWTQVN